MPYVVITRPHEMPRTVRVLARGNWQDETGEVVSPAVPEFLKGPASTEGRHLTRLDLAKWTMSEDNPLTARAVVNRLWGRYLGTPISANAIELGSQGVPPSQPELLDWLAIEFRESGWDLRHIIRLIVTSETYRQSADTRADLAVIDPANGKLFARQSALRLPAEAVRDQALAVSRLLEPRIGGPSVFPYQPEGHWEPLNFPKRSYPTSKGADLYRRRLYTWVQHTFSHPMMVTFDAPSRESCIGQRVPVFTCTPPPRPTATNHAAHGAQATMARPARDCPRLLRGYDFANPSQARPCPSPNHVHLDCGRSGSYNDALHPALRRRGCASGINFFHGFGCAWPPTWRGSAARRRTRRGLRANQYKPQSRTPYPNSGQQKGPRPLATRFAFCHEPV